MEAPRLRASEPMRDASWAEPREARESRGHGHRGGGAGIGGACSDAEETDDGNPVLQAKRRKTPQHGSVTSVLAAKAGTFRCGSFLKIDYLRHKREKEKQTTNKNTDRSQCGVRTCHAQFRVMGAKVRDMSNERCVSRYGRNARGPRAQAARAQQELTARRE